LDLKEFKTGQSLQVVSTQYPSLVQAEVEILPERGPCFTVSLISPKELSYAFLLVRWEQHLLTMQVVAAAEALSGILLQQPNL
jgi:hypothetical protein